MDKQSYLEAQARDCRRSADDIRTVVAKRGLLELADRYEREARLLSLVGARSSDA